MRCIIGPSDDGCRTTTAAIAAKRVRTLANQAEATTVPHVGVLVAGGVVAARHLLTAIDDEPVGPTARSEKEEAAGAASRGDAIVRRVRRGCALPAACFV